MCHWAWMSLDVSDIVYGASKDTWNCHRSVVFGYLTRVVLLVVKTSFKRNGKPPVRPPATREGYQSCWKWSSPLGTSRCCFYIKCNVYDYLLFCHIWYETKLSLACSTRDSCNHTVLFRVFSFNNISMVAPTHWQDFF